VIRVRSRRSSLVLSATLAAIVGQSALCGPAVAADELAIVTGRADDADIGVLDADGAGLRRITHSPVWDDTSPAWSPDGRRLAFARSADGVAFRIVIATAAGRGQRLLAPIGGIQEEPAWSPDGTRVVFSLVQPRRTGCQWPELYSAGVNGGPLRRLTRNRVPDGEPVWSATGRIAFTRWVSATNSEIFTMNGDGTGVERLTRSAASERDPAWSPDGARIAFTRQQGGTNAELFVMDAHGRNIRRLTRNRVYDTQPAWSPSGRQLAFASVRNGRHDVYVMPAAGGAARPLTRELDFGHSPAWRPVSRP
jgi:Tol biopolymer transport system component